MVEAVLLSLVGGLIGGCLAWAAFDGYQTATMNFQSFSQVAFAFKVTPSLLARGMFFALVMGLLGGLLPGDPRRPDAGRHRAATALDGQGAMPGYNVLCGLRCRRSDS